VGVRPPRTWASAEGVSSGGSSGGRGQSHRWHPRPAPGIPLGVTPVPHLGGAAPTRPRLWGTRRGTLHESHPQQLPPRDRTPVPARSHPQLLPGRSSMGPELRVGSQHGAAQPPLPSLPSWAQQAPPGIAAGAGPGQRAQTGTSHRAPQPPARPGRHIGGGSIAPSPLTPGAGGSGELCARRDMLPASLSAAGTGSVGTGSVGTGRQGCSQNQQLTPRTWPRHSVWAAVMGFVQQTMLLSTAEPAQLEHRPPTHPPTHPPRTRSWAAQTLPAAGRPRDEEHKWLLQRPRGQSVPQGPQLCFPSPDPAPRPGSCQLRAPAAKAAGGSPGAGSAGTREQEVAR